MTPKFYQIPLFPFIHTLIASAIWLYNILLHRVILIARFGGNSPIFLIANPTRRCDGTSRTHQYLHWQGIEVAAKQRDWRIFLIRFLSSLAYVCYTVRRPKNRLADQQQHVCVDISHYAIGIYLWSRDITCGALRFKNVRTIKIGRPLVRRTHDRYHANHNAVLPDLRWINTVG